MKRKLTTLQLQDLSYIAIFILTIIIMFTSIVVSANSITTQSSTEILVQEGDTLWEIAETYRFDADLSISEFIAWVEKVNHIDGDRIFPGQQLIIPVGS